MGREDLIIRSNYDSDEEYNIALKMLPDLLHNIEGLKKILSKKEPPFSFSDEQIKQQLSKERIKVFIKAKTVDLSFEPTKAQDKEIRKQYLPNSYLPSNYSRTSYFMTRPETSQENKEFNKKIYTGLTRDDIIGQKQRLNYAIENMHSFQYFDSDKLPSLNSPMEKFNFYLEHLNPGQAAQEQDFFSKGDIKFNESGKKKWDITRNYGTSYGTLALKYLQTASSNPYLTFPMDFLDSDSMGLIYSNMKELNIKGNEMFVFDLLLFEKSTVNESIQIAPQLKNVVFTENDFNDTETVMGGYDSQITALLDGLTSLENIQLSGIYASEENKAALDTICEHSSTIKSRVTAGSYYLSKQDIKEIGGSLAKISASYTKIEKFIAKQPKPNENKAYITINAFKPTSSLFQRAEQVDALIQYQQSDEALIPGTEELNILRKQYQGELLTVDNISEYKKTLGTVLENAKKRLSQGNLSDYEREIIELSVARFECQIKSLEKTEDGVTLKEALSLPVKSPIKKISSLDKLVLTLNTAQYLEGVEGFEQLRQDCKNLKALVDFQLIYCPDELSPQASKKLQDAFTKYINSSTEFLKAHGEELPESVRMAIEYSNIPLISYRDNLESGATEFSAVIKDTNWFKKLFNQDTPAPKVDGYNPKTDAYKASEHTVEENINKYKELSSGMPKILEHHLEVVTGNSKDPYGALDFKMGLLIDNIKDIYKNPEPSMLELLEQTPAKFKELRDDFDPSKYSLSSGNTLFSQSVFEKKYENNLSTHRLAEMSPVVWDPEIFKNIKDAVSKKLRFKAADLGINDKLYDALENSNVFVNNLLAVKSFLNDGLSVSTEQRTDPSKNPEDPLYGIYHTVDLLVENAYGYLRGDEKAHVPNIEDLKELLSQIKTYVESADMYMEGRSGKNILSGEFERIEDVLGIIEGIGPDIAEEVKNVRASYQKKQIDEYNSLFDELTNTSFEADYKTTDIYLKLHTLGRNIRVNYDKFVNDSEYHNYRYLLAITTPQFYEDSKLELDAALQKAINNFGDTFSKQEKKELDKELRKIKIYKPLLLMEYFNKQRDLINNQADSNDFKGKFLNGCNPALETLFISGKEDLSVEKFNQIVNNYMEQPFIKELMEMDPVAFKEFMENPEHEKIMDAKINGPDRLKDISDEALDTLFQSRRLVGVDSPLTFSKTNSQEYKDMQNAFLNVSNCRVTPGSDMKEAYNDLFKKCFTYVLRKSAEPSTEVGKQRFNGACEVLLELGLSLKKDYPDLANNIDAALNLTAIRSKDFREEYLNKTEDVEIKEYLLDLDVHLKATTSKGMVPGEIKNDRDGVTLLNKYSNVKQEMAVNRAFNDICDAYDQISIKNETLAKKILTGQGSGDVVNLLSELMYVKTERGNITKDNLTEYNDKELVSSKIESYKPYVEFVLSHTAKDDMIKLIQDDRFADKFYQGVKRVSEDKKLAPKAQSEYLSRHENELDGPQDIDEVDEIVEVKKSKKM